MHPEIFLKECFHFVYSHDSSSNNFALKGKRKTLTAADVFSALEDMEFGQFIPELKECLEGKLVVMMSND